MSESKLIREPMENRISTLQDLIQDRHLSLCSVGPSSGMDLYFIDSSQDNLTFVIPEDASSDSSASPRNLTPLVSGTAKILTAPCIEKNMEM